MKKYAHVALLVGLFIFALIFASTDGPFQGNQMKLASAMDWTISAIGSIIAILSALRLFQAAIQKAKLSDLLPPIIALLAGLTFYQRYWAIPVSLAAIIVCWLIMDRLRPPQEESGE
jgi:hypothetical protein